MALFQVSVLNTYLKLQEEQKLANAFKKFSKYFHNPVIQENIRNSKEEQFQATFLTELFVNVLGYTLNPQPDFNLSTEFKNENNARKADGAILKDGVAIGVIELKGTNTKDLEGIRRQAFDYKVNQKSCLYVITSNFEKLRFYINDATEFIEFDLFLLTAKDFALLYLCLQKENILKNLPLKIKESSVVKEEQITKDFYKDYSVFKRELYRDLVRLNAKTLKNIRLSDPDFSGVEESNPDYAKSQALLLRLEKNVKLELFKKSQKLIDRFLFIFFAEDRGLLPPNSTIRIVKDWNKLKELDAVVPLYNRFKLYFSYLDQGRKSTDTRAEIFAYNGGLFKPDNLLDRLEINDELLAKHTTQLSKYDFESQVDVNILGHIFENSLNEIEGVNAEIEGGDFDKQKSKRKKDGVFYTPKYITKYIVENTLGKLCEEKKSELGFREEEYYKGRKRRQKDTLESLVKILDDYRAWLLQLTICDPACGSGAFLNQALDFLIKEHRYIDELKAKLLGGGLVFSDIETTILENNIFGVDINEESIEIAKLSLWLRTAQPRRKLNDLSSNIKCGNSLIDDKKVAGNKAFKWEEEFKDVFAKGGFDVVIGNPPYVRQELFTDIKNTLQQIYNVFQSQADLYVYFFELGHKILKEDGYFSMIVANKWLRVTYAHKLREWLIKKKIIEIIDFGDLPVFADASAYPCIITIKNNSDVDLIKVTTPTTLNFGSLDIYVQQNSFSVNPKYLSSNNWQLVDNNKAKILKKINNQAITLHKYTNGVIRRGIVTGFNEAFVINEATRNSLIKAHPSSQDIIKPFLAGRDVKRNTIEFQDSYIIFTRRGIEIEKFPAVLSYLSQFKLQLEPKPKGWKGNWPGRKSGSYQWYEIQDSIEYFKEFEKPKIIYPNICKSPQFCLDRKGYYTNQKCFIIPLDDNYLLSVLNSRIMFFFFKMNLPKLRGDYFEPGYIHLRKFPIPECNNKETHNKITTLVEHTCTVNKGLQILTSKFYNYIVQIIKATLPKKLDSWYELEFGEFIKELNKAIKASNKVRTKEGKSPIPELTKKDEFEWMELFEENKKKAVELQQQIDGTDRKIDQMVYELYELTAEEISIVENS